MNPKNRELRELSSAELQSRLEDAHREQFNLRFQHFTRQLANYRRIGQVRRDIARMKTILRERELGIDQQG